MRKNARILRGEVRAELCGGGTERLLDFCAAGGPRLWDVAYADAFTLRASLFEDDLPRLEKLCALCGCELTKKELRGGSGERKRLMTRSGLAVLAAVCALLLTLSGLFIWEIEVVGNERLSKGEILRALAECGVSEGCFWPGTDAERIRSDMLLRCEGLAWMTLNVRGSRATVLVLERREKPDIYNEGAAAELVASRGGVVRSLSVKNGTALVARGELVAKGQTLVSATMDSPGGETRRVRAEGGVTADTWPERVIFLCPGAREKERERGLRVFLGLRIGKSRAELVTNSRKELDECDKIVKEYNLEIKGLFRFPLALVVEIYRPYRAAGEAAPDYGGARTRALEALSDEIDGEIVSFDFEEVDGRLILRAHCIENIAQTKESKNP